MNAHYQKGFNLIEALIAVVVLTLGLLGIAAMQLTSMRNTQGSYYRSQATTLANDFVERIYANRPNSSSYIFNINGTSASADCLTAAGASSIAATDILAVGCSNNGNSNDVSSLLPAGSLQAFCINAASDVQAACTSETNMRMQINVNWTERGTVKEGASAAAMDTANLENQTLTLKIQP
jgi:type IV pilus modification protein PilV